MSRSRIRIRPDPHKSKKVKSGSALKNKMLDPDAHVTDADPHKPGNSNTTGSVPYQCCGSNTDPHPAFFVNADPDTDPNKGFWWQKIGKNL
jgi:hypothetical protein